MLLLKKVGFIESDQDPLFKKLWYYMSGTIQNCVTLNNARMFLLAILGVLVENGPQIDRATLTPINLGTVNGCGDVFLSYSDMLFMKKTFK